MPRLTFLRFFQPPLELLLDRGHHLHLLLESSRAEPVEEEWLELARGRPNFSCDVVTHFKDAPLSEERSALRTAMEYVRRRQTRWANRIAGRPRNRLARATVLVRQLARLPLLRTNRGLGALYAALEALDRAVPPAEAVVDCVERLRPDVVALCDKGFVGSLSSDYIRAAAERGIPNAIVVASWDNLTNRQKTLVRPDRLLVWNERQRWEAKEFHDIPGEIVEITGAPRFDFWFTGEPSDRGEFLTRVGLDPDRPVICWTGCALQPGDTTEAQFVERWLAELRSSDDASLREAGVLIRPHPERLDDWIATDFSGWENVAQWPRHDMAFPIDSDARSEYFDSLYHAAVVVGINTSAMIEASILGRPVLTVLVPEFHDSQQATFHFSYLLDSEGGPVRPATTMADHLAALSGALSGTDTEHADRVAQFVSDFVRPRGLELPATDLFVDALEGLASSSPTPRPTRTSPLLLVVLPLLQLGRAVRLAKVLAGHRGFRRRRRRLVRFLRRIASFAVRRGRRFAKFVRRSS